MGLNFIKNFIWYSVFHFNDFLTRSCHFAMEGHSNRFLLHSSQDKNDLIQGERGDECITY